MSDEQLINCGRVVGGQEGSWISNQRQDEEINDRPPCKGYPSFPMLLTDELVNLRKIPNYDIQGL